MRTFKALIAAVACLVLTGAGCATPAPSSNVVEAAPFHLAADQHSRMIRFRRIVENIPPGTVIGDWNCGSGKNPIIYDTSLHDLDPKYNGEIFKGALAQAGYQILDPEGSLFDAEDKEAEAQLQVGAKVTQMMANGCLPERSVIGVFRPDLASVFDPTMDMTLTIEWQFYDPIARKVVGVTTTQGRATLTEKRATVVNSVYRLAFAQAVRNLAADPAFLRVAIGSGEPSPPQAEAKAPPPETVIGRLPLSTMPFQEQSAAIEKQVVTVFSAAGHGSGFYIADGLLLTNHHVVGDAESVRLHFVSGKDVMGSVVTSDARRDVALIQTEPVGVHGLPLRLEDPQIAERVFVIGSPLDPKLNNTVSAGIVSAFRKMRGQKFIQSDANTQHGNSGGPLLDDKGNILGITESGMEQRGVAEGINFFIPIGEALDSVGVTLQAAPAPKKTSQAETKHATAP